MSLAAATSGSCSAPSSNALRRDFHNTAVQTALVAKVVTSDNPTHAMPYRQPEQCQLTHGSMNVCQHYTSAATPSDSINQPQFPAMPTSHTLPTGILRGQLAGKHSLAAAAPATQLLQAAAEQPTPTNPSTSTTRGGPK